MPRETLDTDSRSDVVRWTWRKARVPPVVRALVRPAALVWLVVTVSAHLAGALDGLERWLERAERALAPAVSRAHAPTVLAVDEAAVERLGPPPWPLDTWAVVAEALDRQGLGRVVLADPWPRLVDVTVPWSADPELSVRLVVPASAWDGRPLPTLPVERPRFVASTEATLALTDGPTGAVDAARVAPAWLPCAEVPCGAPGGSVPLRAADVPVVSLATLLDAGPRFLVPGEAGVLLGLTAVPHAEPVAAGPDGAPVPWVLATARSIASLRAAGVWPPLGGGARAGWLAAIYVAAAALTRGTGARRLLLVPAAIGAAALGLRALGIGVPLVASVIVALLPGVTGRVAVARASQVTLRRLSLLVIRGASRAGTLRRRLETPDALLEVLADLTRNHADEAPFALLLVQPVARRLVFHGGHGTVAGDFVDRALRLGHPDVAAAASAWSGVESSRLRRDGAAVRLLPLSQGGAVVGFWVVVAQPGRTPPDARRLGRLARWVGERLALPSAGGTFTADTELLADRAEDEALDNLFAAADEERRRWQGCLQRVGVPLLVADVGGVVNTINPALQEALQQAGLPRVRSVRELVLRLDGEGRLDRWMHALFVEGRTVEVPWPDGAGGTLVLRPVASEQEGGGLDQPLLGYVGWLDLRAPAEAPPVGTGGAAGADETELDLPRLRARTG